MNSSHVVQADILITNANPVTACLADFEFTTIVLDPGLEIGSSESEVGGGATPFMAPELLVPSRFGLEGPTPSKEADIYATAMVIYQVRATDAQHTLANSSQTGTHWGAAIRQTVWVRGNV